jgi:hypothetical protein
LTDLRRRILSALPFDAGAGSFAVGYFPSQFTAYAVTPSLLCPMMFLTPAFYKGAEKGAAALPLLVGTAAIHYRHQNYLKRVVAVRDGMLGIVKPDDLLLCNMNIAKLLQPAFGKRHLYMLAMAGNEKGMQKARRAINAALAQRNQRVLVAIRGGTENEETNQEQTQAGYLQREYATRPLPIEGRTGLPGNVQVFRLSDTGNDKPRPSRKRAEPSRP